MYNIKNGLDYQKKRAKRKDTSDEKFLTAVVNFLIMALIVFCIVKAMNAAGERFGHKEEKEPDTKECPYCKSKIAIAATRCPNCTSMIGTADESENSDTFIA